MSEDRRRLAFDPTPISGYGLEQWRVREGLIRSDVLFALGFTSYQMLLNYIGRQPTAPIDPLREILIRLYLLEPEFPSMFVAPDILQFVDYVFNLKEGEQEESRRRCIGMLAPLLGRNRGSGYRWLRSSMDNDKSAVRLSIRRLVAKVFSMNPKTAREDFWKVTFATASARGMNTKTVRACLTAHEVKIG